MFRIECFVDDKHLAKVMHGLSGLCMELQVVPVVNAETKNGKVMAKTSGDTTEMLAKWLHEQKKHVIRPDDIKQFCLQHGRAEKSYSNVLAKAKKAGLLSKPKGKGNQVSYTVMAVRK